MQTVNFNCPHCGNLMAVGTNLLGRNVRCPHCKQVVRAPSAAGEPPVQSPVATPPPPPVPTPTFNLPQQTEHHESIFGERHDEDVFGSEPLKPTFAPLQSAALPPTLQEMAPAPPDYQPPPPLPEPLAFDAPTVTVQSMPVAPDPYEQRATDQPPPRELEERPPPGYRARPRKEEAPGTPAFAWILLIYAAIITIAAGFFGYQYFIGDSKNGDQPFKAMPDVIRQYDPAKKTQMSFLDMPDSKQDVPADLRVKLGDEITVGDLKVRPVSVQPRVPKAVTKYKAAGEDKVRELGGVETLVLTLHVTNVSKDTVFDPYDPAFVRAFDANQPAPYTALEIGQHFFYGTFKWPPDADVEKEYFEGQDAEQKLLRPGEERDIYITLAPPGARAAGGYDFHRPLGDLRGNDSLLWRVQLRRGLADFQDGDKVVNISATTVIGVEFQKAQIR